MILQKILTRNFAGDCFYFHEIKDNEDTVKFYEDIDRLGCWAYSWGMRFQPIKCNILHFTRKRIKTIIAPYTLEGTVLDDVEKAKYLDITITNDFKWNTQVRNICTKASRTVCFHRRNLAACPQDVKESAYQGLVHPVLEYVVQFGAPKLFLKCTRSCFHCSPKLMY